MPGKEKGWEGGRGREDRKGERVEREGGGEKSEGKGVKTEGEEGRHKYEWE